MDDLVAAECIHCGEIMINSITKPFVTEDDAELIRSWYI